MRVKLRTWKVGRKAPISAAIMLACSMPYQAHAVLEEIIVTANKRAQSANDIGLSIAAISGDKLAEQKLTTLEEITSGVPSLVFATSQQNTPILTLRGVGFNESSIGVYPAVSLYVDEIPLPFPAMASHSAYDLERAEVLKGPQGVLFGQNSTGGAINFIAAKPTDETSYGVDLSYGSYNKIELNGYVSGALTDTASARLAIQSVQADDWQESVTSNRENGEEDYTAVRMAYKFTPSDSAEINVNVNGWRDKSDPQALQMVAASPKRFDQSPGNAAAQFALPFANQDAESADWSGEQRGDKEFIQFSVRGDFEVADGKTLTALVARSDYEQNQAQDGDGTALVLADFIHNKADIQSTFAEVRLASESDSSRWVVGANYEDSATYEDQLLRYTNNTTNRPQTFFLHQNGDILDQDIKSYAVFGNVEVDVAEDMTLKLGARYTDTTIDAKSCNYVTENVPGQPDASVALLGAPGVPASILVPNSNLASIFNFLGLASGRAFDLIGPGDCFTLDAPPLQGVPGFEFADSLGEDNVSWRAGLDYNANDSVLLYANLSQGYKAGSYPVLAANDYTQLQPVTQESVMAFEAGFKASLRDGTIQWNGAAFHYDYEDKQVRGKINIPLFGPLDRLVNIPESTITGIETDIVAQLTEKLTLTAAITALDSEVDKYPATIAFDAYGVNRDLSGEDVPFTPELSYSLDLDYRTPLSNGGMMFAGINVVGQSESDAAFDADDLSLDNNVPRDVGGGVLQTGLQAGVHKSITENYFVVDSYYTVGARAGYESEDGRYRVMVWGKNITDEYYWNSVIASSEGAARAAGRPATYGVSVSYKY